MSEGSANIGGPRSDPRDYVLEISSVAITPPPGLAEEESGGGSAGGGRPYLSILFKCCNAYARIHRTADGRAYAGHCPKCAKPVRIRIGPGGSGCRMFTVEAFCG